MLVAIDRDVYGGINLSHQTCDRLVLAACLMT